MNKIIVIGHGNFASGISSALFLIMGKQKDYYAIDYNLDSNKEELLYNLTKLIKTFKSDDQIIVFTDLKGGTPFNVVMKESFLNENIKLFYGLNLAILLEFVAMRMADENFDISHLDIKTLKNESIGCFDKTDFNYIETDFDDEL